MATSVSPLAQTTASASNARPSWSRTSAVSRTVSPRAVNTTVSGVTATVVGAGGTTTSSARPVTTDEVAVISTSPVPTPVANPASSTTATAVSLDAHENSSTPATTWPFASVASAAKRSVSPATSVSAAGETATVLTSWATITVAVPDADPAVAVIVAVPLPAAVTSPWASTVATAALLLDQVTAAPAITCPFWSRTSAESCTVAPRAVSWVVAGVTATVVGRGGSGGGGSVAPSPHAETQATPASAADSRMVMR